jgi:hypothetical protein
MKLEGHLRRHGCVLHREGKEHSLRENPQTGHAEAVPRHAEISTRRICRKLSISDAQGQVPVVPWIVKNLLADLPLAPWSTRSFLLQRPR